MTRNRKTGDYSFAIDFFHRKERMFNRIEFELRLSDVMMKKTEVKSIKKPKIKTKKVCHVNLLEVCTI